MNHLELECVKKRRVFCVVARLRGGFLAVSLGLVSCALWPSTARAQTFTSSGAITISNGAAASTPYPSTIDIGTNGAVSLPGTIQKLTITLTGLNSQTPQDLGFMLVAPNGSAYEFMSYAGSTTHFVGNLVFDDNAGATLPFNTALAPGTYRPASYFCETTLADSYPLPAPQTFNYAAPCGTATLAAEFGGMIPDGTWSLYLANRLFLPPATLGSWSLNFTESSPNLGLICSHFGNFCQGQMEQYSLTVRNNGPGFSGGTVPVTVTDTLPAGLTPVSASGSGWNYVIVAQVVTCTTTNPAAAGTSYPPITLTVNVAANAPASVNNTPSVSGGGAGNTDVATVNTTPAATITPSPSLLCPNSTGNQASAPAGASTYSWSITNGSITSATNLQTVTYTAGPSGSVGLTVQVGNATGCTATNSLSVPILVDTTPPTITCSSNITVTAVGHCPVAVNFNVSASDNCTVSSLVATPASGSAFPVGTNTVTVVATDGSGNTNNCTFKVTVLPGPAPRLAAVLAGTNVVLSWPSAAGCYALQSTPALLSPPASNLWITYAGPLATNGGSIFATNSTPLASQFYRLAY